MSSSRSSRTRPGKYSAFRIRVRSGSRLRASHKRPLVVGGALLSPGQRSLSKHRPSTHRQKLIRKSFSSVAFSLSLCLSCAGLKNKTVGPSSHTTVVGLRCSVHTKCRCPGIPGAKIGAQERSQIFWGRRRINFDVGSSLFLLCHEPPPEVFDVWFFICFCAHRADTAES